MPPQILSPEWQQQYESLRMLLQRALWLSERCADYDGTQVLRARLTNLQAPALLVVVGEVKAGKSSFINALLRENVCETAPGPCTTRIQELVYGTERTVTKLGRAWERIFLPKDVLREVTIVDTPGTNSLIQNHQTITENYVPQTDLVIFVFSAANPHTKSAWEFLSVIRKDWHRKIVFLLQQSDRASEKELSTNRELVTQYARDRHVLEPTVFTLSAKCEIEGAPGSGFESFREFLRGAIERGEVWRMKVEGAYETVRSVMTKLRGRLHRETEALTEERAFYQGLVGKVEAREAKAQALKQLMIGRITTVYDDLARRSEDEFARRISLGSVTRRIFPFARKSSDDPWASGLKARFQSTARKQIAAEARQVSKALTDEMQGLLEELTASLARRQEGIRENASLPTDADGLKALQQLRMRLERIRVGEGIANGVTAERSSVSRLAIAGAVLGIIGAIVAVFSHNPLLNFTGVIFAGFGIALFTAGMFWRRADLLREFREKLGASRKEFCERVEAEFAIIFDGLFFELRQALGECVFRLDLQISHVGPVAEEAFHLGETASEMLLRFQQQMTAPPLHQMSGAFAAPPF
ncbi:MAG: dynamin family protein [Verrucomicrobiota bacterium]|nr:dynamin family protein [Verrucomicrobiota bacterium]